MNLSQEVSDKIKALYFKSDAERIPCLLPLGSIIWMDELPDPDRFFLLFASGEDRDFVMKLFAIRINYWNTGTMGDEEQLFWEQAHAQFPDWPIFQRLRLKETDRAVHETIQNEAENFFTELAGEA